MTYIMGITGAIDWDGNDPEVVGEVDPWIHGSGITLFKDDEFLISVSEERFTRIKHDGNFPEQSIKNVFDRFNLTHKDIDYICYVPGVATPAYPKLYQDFTIQKKFRMLFPNAKFVLYDHHPAHAYASYCTSSFDDANVITFDGAGNFFHMKMEVANLSYMLIPDNFTFCIANKEHGVHAIHHSYHPFETFNFGSYYNSFSAILYNVVTKKEDIFIINHAERETYPGKMMGLAGYGDHTKVDFPDPFYVEKDKQGGFDLCKVLTNKDFVYHHFAKKMVEGNTDVADAAAWVQHQFEKYVMIFIENIHPLLKRDVLCLGGGCGLNILLNSKLVEQGYYKDVHINTATNDDGLSFGAACIGVIKILNKFPQFPKNQGCIGLDYSEDDIEEALEEFGVEHDEG